ncbi:2Fe-2S iron-sulfur cluster-binding protein [Poseidonocella sp. HB161398]|uniref:2Fe-2S iron-sulfur cluster-binding protein n=1 Tax=Poseidonocella sp. HB161398 TaxID=2320855 RepID=UPI001107EE7C|nr:2Fe-2S iron-sulfur cluster-binding protein [Poseidonocella sp. HB161398]
MNAQSLVSAETAAEAPRAIPVRLTVNGRAEEVLATPRTQLAEILRDKLDLTATHLACEQGVCGACTVMVDGRPQRACLTFAAECDGATVETLEGWEGDALMDRLRAAFARNHALQCGFCTPGMLATARDLAARLETADETRIRHELSGNLCRCTGYVGIVAAITEVIAERDAAGIAPVAPPPLPEPAPPAGFAPFEPVAAPQPEAAIPQGETRTEDGWTIVRRSFVLDHPADAVWAAFRDLATVARCLPGAELGSTDGDRFAGHVAVRFGPITARFEGEGLFAADDAERRGTVTGQGKDRGGQSSVAGELGFAVAEGASPGTSEVAAELRFRIEGRLGQFNRPELVSGLVDHLLAEFAANCSALLSGGPMRESRGISVWALARAAIAGLFRRR